MQNSYIQQLLYHHVHTWWNLTSVCSCSCCSTRTYNWRCCWWVFGDYSICGCFDCNTAIGPCTQKKTCTRYVNACCVFLTINNICSYKSIIIYVGASTANCKMPNARWIGNHVMLCFAKLNMCLLCFAYSFYSLHESVKHGTDDNKQVRKEA